MPAENRRGTEEEKKVRGYHVPELLTIWGDHPDELIKRMDHWTQTLASAGDGSGCLKSLSREAHRHVNQRETIPDARLALTAYSERELEKKLAQVRKMIEQQPEAPFSFPSAGLFYGRGAPLGRTAFLFPGQGAQYLGMGGPLAKAYPVAARVWETLGATRFDDKSIREIVFPEDAGDEASAKKAFLRLCDADWTNPAIAVVGEAVFALLGQMGLFPDAVAAHSFGDVSAFRSAGILSAEDMLAAIRYRGELGVACPLATRGCILIVAESAEKTRTVLDANGFDDVWIANYNTPQQTVLSGVKESVFRAHQVFETKGIGSQLIPISAAPHCPLAVDVADKFFAYVQDLAFRPARCDVYSFLFGRKVGNDPDLFRKLLKAHVEKPVRFLSQIEQMYQDGIRIFVEIGPADILTKLVGQILGDRPHLALATDRRKGDPLLTFLNTVGDLFKEGVIDNLEPLWQGYAVPDSHDGAGGRTRENGVRDKETEKRLKMLEMEFARIEQERTPARAV